RSFQGWRPRLITGRRKKPLNMFAPNDLLTVEIPPVLNFVSRSPLPRGCLLVYLAVACFAFSPCARAVTPAPDGGYPGVNTAEGTNALFSLTNGFANTALGYQALYHNTTSDYNTGVGFNALVNNTAGTENTAL